MADQAVLDISLRLIDDPFDGLRRARDRDRNVYSI